MQNIKKDLTQDEFKAILRSHKNSLQKTLSLKDTILLYENSIKKITSQKDAFILLVDLESSNLKVATLDIDIPIKSDIYGIIFKCYETKISHTITNARRNSIYRQKIDNFIDAKIKDILVIPILDDTKDKNIIAIIWVATKYKSQDEFTQKDINYLNELNISIREEIILNNKEIVKKNLLKDNDFYDNLNILIIDDSPIIIRFIEFVLKDYNTHIITASNSMDGIEKFKYKKIDIVFIDEMLIGMVEDQIIETIRHIEIEKKFDSIPIFAITGDTNNKTKKKLLESGANIVLHKPMDGHHIIDAIKEFRVLNRL